MASQYVGDGLLVAVGARRVPHVARGQREEQASIDGLQHPECSAGGRLSFLSLLQARGVYTVRVLE
eukprot:122926-Prymnesium_polylepis.1